MKRWGIIVFLYASIFCFFSNASAQNVTNEGTDFWAVFPTHDPSGRNNDFLYANIKVYVTSKSDSRVTVTCNGWTSGLIDVRANEAVPVFVPRENAYINPDERYVNKAIHVVVEPGFPKVAVYAHIFAGARSAASLILPNESLGQQYYSMNYAQTGNNGNGVNKNYLVLVATEADTRLIIHKSNTSETVVVNLTTPGDIYEYMPEGQDDITGTYVEIDPLSDGACTKRFAAFSGSTSVTIGCDSSRDPLYQQLYPTTSWGRTYGIVPFINRKYVVRIIAQDDNTAVRFNGSTLILNKGQFYSSEELSEPTFVTADKKVSVAQYSLTQDCSSSVNSVIPGDPEMVLLNPIEFNIKSVILFSSTDQSITERYINVFIKTSARLTFKINGVAPSPSSWRAMPTDASYSYIQIPIVEINSILTANDGFNAIAYGFGSYESYSYSAGTNLAANNYLLIKNTQTNVDAPNACKGQESNFKIVLAYKAQKITWQLDGGAVVTYTPTPIEGGTAGNLTYTYIYNTPYTFNQLELHNMVVTATMPNNVNCLGGDVEYQFTFEVYPIPNPEFAVDINPCPDTEIQFTESSNSNVPDKPVNKWFWDFGDGETSIEQNPKHIFTTSGIKTIKFSAGLDDGCMSDIIEKVITVKAKISPGFRLSATGCVDKDIAFRDESTVESNVAVTSWLWDFGDGNTSTDKNPVHKFSQNGTFTVVLKVKSADGCESIPFPQTIVINKLPVPDFELPEACIEDMAVFTNKSKNADGSENGLTYSWNFGDPGSANNTSTTANGIHKFNTPGDYQVSLTATNASGCSFTKIISFTVNGSTVTPSFTIANQNNLCSNNELVLQSTSSVNSGRITRILFYMDFGNQPNAQPDISDVNPNNTKVYTYKYPAFTAALNKTFVVKMVAYSGTECFSESIKTITVKPSPNVVFSAVPPMCLNSGIVDITQARETLGVNGTGVLTGPGVGSDGKFNPLVAGLGVHTLTYTFSGQNLCSESKTQIVTVNPVPSVVLSSEIFILIGGEKQVDAIATGTGLTYKWSPSIGLSRDDILNPIIQGDDDREYTLTVTSSQGCSTSQKVKVNILRAVEPNSAFSPNGDGINDTWSIKYIDSYPNVSVEIFNRYGQRIFYSEGYRTPFDGNFNNEALPVGTYYYIINPKIGRKNVTGALTIVR
ncbi:MAG: PKD domain-containing protein [Pedobacter sp.]|nr:MAG: PKD domain-containing protein [Pedobacter sp.]